MHLKNSLGEESCSSVMRHKSPLLRQVNHFPFRHEVVSSALDELSYRGGEGSKGNGRGRRHGGNARVSVIACIDPVEGDVSLSIFIVAGPIERNALSRAASMGLQGIGVKLSDTSRGFARLTRRSYLHVALVKNRTHRHGKFPLRHSQNFMLKYGAWRPL